MLLTTQRSKHSGLVSRSSVVEAGKIVFHAWKVVPHADDRALQGMFCISWMQVAAHGVVIIRARSFGFSMAHAVVAGGLGQSPTSIVHTLCS